MPRYVPKEKIIEINKEITAHYGQPHVIQQEANLVHALESVEHYGEGIKEEEGKILKKAAHLLKKLAYEAHVFADGNKRTTFVCVWTFLEINGYLLPHDGEKGQEERAKLMKDAAEGKLPIGAIYRWLKRNVIKIQ